MDTRTGDLYPTKQDALAAGVPERDIAEVRGSKRSINSIRRAIRVARKTDAMRILATRERNVAIKAASRTRKTRSAQQKASRKANRSTR